jgi:hypothetical protein
VRISKPGPDEEAARVAAGRPQRFTYLLSEVQEPAETSFRFTVASMQGESEKAVSRDGVMTGALGCFSWHLVTLNLGNCCGVINRRDQAAALPPIIVIHKQPPYARQTERKPPKPEMKVALGQIIGEEGLVAAPAAKWEDGAFVGLQFLCFPSLTVVMGEEEEDPQAATQDLLATVAGASVPTPGGSGGGLAESGGRMAAASSTGSRPGPAPTRELMNAQAQKAFVRASFDLAIKGLQMGDIQKRTQASMRRFAESLSPHPVPSLSARSASVGAQPSPSSPSPPALSPLRRGMAMHLRVGIMQVELVLANPTAGATAASAGDDGPDTFIAMLVEMKVRVG